MISNAIKRLLRQAFKAGGYTIRDVGRGVSGVELLHDARILLSEEPAPVLFDVGANIGQTTQSMLDAFHAPEIYAFEPSPSTVESLRRAVGNRAGVTVEALAMGDAEGILPFHVTQDYSVNDSLLSPTWNAGGSVVDVRVDTVDNYCGRNRIESISLLKIDAQDDLHVLRGGPPHAGRPPY
ncbi:MAG: FkbM family methyltransferase [Gammaproteobacteria bacterium]